MARTKNPNKEPGRIAQIWRVGKMTVKRDPISGLYLALGFLLPLLAAIAAAVFWSDGNIFFIILWSITGVMAGFLGVLIILGRRAQKVAFDQIQGQAGAVGHVLSTALGRRWQASDMPVAINPKTQDAVYRAVGKAGVVLVAEGPKSRTKKLLDDERRKVVRVLPNVPVHTLLVGPDEGSLKIAQLPKAMRKFKKGLRRADVLIVGNRLASLTQTSNMLPIPKGMDPTKVRAPKPR